MFDKHGLSVLLLCHTPLDGSTCRSAGIPVTMSVMQHAQTLDSDGGVAASERHHRADLRKPLSATLSRRLGSSFDLVTTVCCDYNAFVRPGGRGLTAAWANVAALLRPGGFFVFSTSETGLLSLARFLDVGVDKTKSQVRLGARQRAQVLSALCRHVDSKGMLESVPATARSPFGRWYASFVAEHATRSSIGKPDVAGPSLRESRKEGIVVFRRK